MKSIVTALVGLLLITADAQADTIRFQTDWKAQAEHGGFYQALALGFYQAEGLDVVIKPGGPQVDNPRLLAAGALDIAMASNSFQPFAMQAAGVDAKIVMAAFQKDPQVLMVHGDSNATGFKDLKGKPIFIADSALATFWPWLQARFGFENRQIRKYTYSIAPWLVNKGTVLEGYVSSEPYTAREAGADPKVFLFSDEGYPGYAAMVIVRTEYLEANPETVRAFIRASIKGWQSYIFDDPTPGNQLILKDNPEMTAGLLDYAVGEMRSRNMLGSREKVGHMDIERWQAFYDEMSALGAVDKGLSVDKSVSLDYLPSRP